MVREPYVNKERTNEKLSQGGGNDKCFHCREMVTTFVNANPKITSMAFVEETLESGEIVRTGEISFTVLLEDLGFSKGRYIKFEKEFFSNFMINFFGEFLLRENISDFVNFAYSVDSKDFIKAISSKRYKNFGIRALDNVITFTFHVSLLSNILTEDLRKIDW
jgi:hypothetical protein